MNTTSAREKVAEKVVALPLPITLQLEPSCVSALARKTTIITFGVQQDRAGAGTTAG
jgi:hypothetical protein